MALASIRPTTNGRERPEDRFDRLERMTARPGWDGPRSQAISADAWRKARELARVVADEVRVSAPPFVSPGTDGSIGLRWSTPGRSLSVELAEDGVFFCETLGNDVLADGPTEERDVIRMVRMLYL